MKKYQFSNGSKTRLATCHPDLIKVMNRAIEVSTVDFGIAEGHRTDEKQQQYFAEGKSKVDGIKVKGKHQSIPSKAVDFYPWVNGSTCYLPEVVSFVAGVILAVAADLAEKGEISSEFRWGGNWDMDGEIITDQLFDDLPHIEII